MTESEKKEKMEMCYKMFKKGYKARAIAERLNIDYTTAYKWLRKKGYRLDTRYRTYDVEVVDKIAALYQTMTKNEVAKALNMEYVKVNYIINKHMIRKGEEQ